jgi:hypothetical protein
VYWCRRFVLFHQKPHSKDLGKSDVTAFLNYLVTERHLAASSQSQALNIIVFMYKHVLELEGACGHLVKDRMDITGARWGLERAEAILKLRSLKISGDLPQCSLALIVVFCAIRKLCEDLDRLPRSIWKLTRSGAGFAPETTIPPPWRRCS